MTYLRQGAEAERLREEVARAVDALEVKHYIKPTKKQRAVLEKTMFQTLLFNRKLLQEGMTNVYVVQRASKLAEIYLLRSRVYRRLGYDKEFPESVEGINFDSYDAHAAILYTQKEGRVTGTCRIIFDVKKNLPIDKNYALDEMRQTGEAFAELSRLIIDKDENRGLGQEFRYLAAGVYRVMQSNQLYRVVSVIAKEHFSLYKKFGGFVQKALLYGYGELEKPFVITQWNIKKVSPLFKRGFLGRVA
jgi:hypothetical protein